ILVLCFRFIGFGNVDIPKNIQRIFVKSLCPKSSREHGLEMEAKLFKTHVVVRDNEKVLRKETHCSTDCTSFLKVIRGGLRWF
ncbi:hypothetical protein, partial [Archaeoglobus sp.]|uniref:hypothetical protein n=1 Tax=Archaeoglobus sp. TaxID=1872626 RepID=UPI0025C66EB7